MAERENNLNYGAYCGLYCGAELYDCRAEERDLTG